MTVQNLHTHTTWCDGKNAPEDYIRAAVELGMKYIGFSGHSNTPFDPHYCMNASREAGYRAEIAALREKYAGQIRVLRGIEQDVFSEKPWDGYDYVIGSVHYLHLGDEYVPTDGDPKHLVAAADKYFGGDVYALLELYFASVSHVVEDTDADIIGHFDVISKYNIGTPWFDESHPRYVRAWQNALDTLLATGKPFEMNAGPFLRGLRPVPYPTPEMQAYITARGGRLIRSADSHNVEIFRAFHAACADPDNVLSRLPNDDEVILSELFGE